MSREAHEIRADVLRLLDLKTMAIQPVKLKVPEPGDSKTYGDFINDAANNLLEVIRDNNLDNASGQLSEQIDLQVRKTYDISSDSFFARFDFVPKCTPKKG